MVSWTPFRRFTTELQGALGSSYCGDKGQALGFYFCSKNLQLFRNVYDFSCYSFSHQLNIFSIMVLYYLQHQS